MTAAALQLPLYAGIREPTVPTRASELDEQARAFLRDNPSFWHHFCRFADELWQRGRIGGAKLICERIRWECRLEGRGSPKVNNSHVASFARIYAATYPERAGLFRTRTRASAERRARG